jgi:hypothetical protein
MIKRNYYSVRTGKIIRHHQVNFEVLKRLFSVFYNKLNSEGSLFVLTVKTDIPANWA